MFKIVIESEYNKMVEELKQLRLEKYTKDKDSIILSPFEEMDIVEKDHLFKFKREDRLAEKVYFYLECMYTKLVLPKGRKLFRLYDANSTHVGFIFLDVTSRVNYSFYDNSSNAPSTVLYYETEEDYRTAKRIGEAIFVSEYEFEQMRYKLER